MSSQDLHFFVTDFAKESNTVSLAFPDRHGMLQRSVEYMREEDATALLERL